VAAFAILASGVVQVAMPAPASAGSCGVERWGVKTGTDRGAASVNLNASAATTVAYLTSQPRPASLPSNSRVAPVETTQWVLDATLVEDKFETDSDYHLVLHDSAGRSMIAEIPSPSCVAASSPFLSAIQRARAQFDSSYAAKDYFATVNVPVRVTGVGFFDFEHGQTGVAPNAVELHPVTNIVFNPSGPVTSTGSSSAPVSATSSPSVAASPANAPSSSPSVANGGGGKGAPPGSQGPSGSPGPAVAAVVLILAGFVLLIVGIVALRRGRVRK